ncbi:MAG: hypothetical protein ACYSUI_21090, partial [Planctomycetota bacterium]
GIRDGDITDGPTLRDECLGTGTESQPDPVYRIAKACTDQVRPNKIARSLQRRCEGRDVNLVDAFGGGECATEAGLGAQELEFCLEPLAECAACRWINAADGLDRDCELFDNGQADGSCP